LNAIFFFFFFLWSVENCTKREKIVFDEKKNMVK